MNGSRYTQGPNDANKQKSLRWRKNRRGEFDVKFMFTRKGSPGKFTPTSRRVGSGYLGRPNLTADSNRTAVKTDLRITLHVVYSDGDTPYVMTTTTPGKKSRTIIRTSNADKFLSKVLWHHYGHGWARTRTPPHTRVRIKASVFFVFRSFSAYFNDNTSIARCSTENTSLNTIILQYFTSFY